MLTRRNILKRLGIAPTALPFLSNLPSMAAEANAAQRKKQRLVIVFTPDGVVKDNFWPTSPGLFSTDRTTSQQNALPPILTPFESIQDKLLLVKGVHNQIRGDGDGHMRGIGCLLTGIELFPGNIRGVAILPLAGPAGSLLTKKSLSTCKPMPQRQHGFVHSSLVYSFPTRLTLGHGWSTQDQINHLHRLMIHTRCSISFTARSRTGKT